jgi:hypothetical protein
MSIKDYVPEQFVSLFSDNGFQEAMKGYLKFLVKEDKDFRVKITSIVETVLQNSFDARLVTSELRPIKRIAELEQTVGLEDYSEDDDEFREPNIPDRIQTLEEKIKHHIIGATENPAIQIKLKSKTGKRAMALIKALTKSGKGHLTRTKIREVLSDEKDEDLGDARITENSSNPRRDIIDAINEAKKLCSSVVPDKKGYGRHEWRLVLKS